MSQLRVSLSPHVRDRGNTQTIMMDVLIALLPACIAGVCFFGYEAAILLATGVLSAVLCEHIWCVCTKRPTTVTNLSAAVTGLLVAMNVPSTAPWWVVVLGSAFAIIIVKSFFGGLGHNFLNPAMAARAFMLASWPTQLTIYTRPNPTIFSSTSQAFDAVSSATPLMSLYGKAQDAIPALRDMMIGEMPGCIGEVSKVALLVGAAYLIIRGVISLKIPLTFISTVFVLSALFGGAAPSLEVGLYSIAAGGLMLGAMFMATDYVTCPMTSLGQVVYALGCGAITFVIRKFGAFPEGVTYAILIMNVVTPLIDRMIKPRIYGEVAKAK